MISLHRFLFATVSVVAVASSATADEIYPGQEEAIAAIQKMNGRVELDRTRPGNPVVRVHLFEGKTAGIGLAPLEKLPEIEWIGLHLADITEADLEHLKKLKKLRRIGLADLKFINDVSLGRIEDMTQLEMLGLRENQLTDACFDRLTKLKKLKQINLGKTRVTDVGLARLSMFPDLEVVTLDQLKITDVGIAHLGKLEKLTYLYLDGCGAVSDLSPLASRPITELSLGWTSVADLSPLKGMKLTKLNCFATKVTDLSPLAECKKLTSLDVRRTKVSAKEVETLQKALPNCKIEWDAPKVEK